MARVILYLYILLHLAMWWFGRTTNFWTFVCVLALIIICTRALLGLLQRRQLINGALVSNLMLATYTFWGALLITEIVFRSIFPDLRSYIENAGSDYCSGSGTFLRECDSCDQKSFFINDPGTSSEIKRPEFNYTHHYNAWGLRDHAFTTTKNSHEYRILALGDSFVEGMGTSDDSTWVKQLEWMLNKNRSGLNYTTLNGGVIGSDLFFSYELLKRCLLKYKPDLVILNLNSTDVNDIFLRGGPERFDTNGNYYPKTGPWWEFYFGTSFIVRAITLHALHYSWNLVTAEEQAKIDTKIIAQISKKLNDYQALANEEHFKFLLTLQPLQNELNDSSFVSRLRVAADINKIDLTPALADSIKCEHGNKALYYWPLDGHFTGRGYNAEAAIIYHHYFSPVVSDSIYN